MGRELMRAVVRLKMPREGTCRFTDLIRGEVEFAQHEPRVGGQFALRIIGQLRGDGLAVGRERDARDGLIMRRECQQWAAARYVPEPHGTVGTAGSQQGDAGIESVDRVGGGIEHIGPAAVVLVGGRYQSALDAGGVGDQVDGHVVFVKADIFILPGSLQEHAVFISYRWAPTPGFSGDATVDGYNRAVGSLESRVLVGARRFQQLGAAADRDVPVLGICLGCQLLADALGGRAFRGQTHEAEFGRLDLTDQAIEDPVVRTLAEPVLSFHGDTFDPPPGAQVLAKSARYLHAFRYGSAVAIQSHPEAGAGITRRWVERYGREKLVEEGVDPDELLATVEEADSLLQRRAAEMFGAWLGEVIASQA